MNKKGFTLVELLAVIVVLAIILAIAVPGISGIIKKTTKSAMGSNAKLILKAADYKRINDDSFDITSIDVTKVSSILNLSNKNYESVKITMENNLPVISIVGKDKWQGLIACGTFHNMMVTESISDCSLDLVPPVITILGDNPINLSVGELYLDEGATAEDDLDGDITHNIVVTGTVNLNAPGVYTITYSVSDNAGNSATEIRTVNVIDDVAPVITFEANGNEEWAKNRSTTVTVSDAGEVNDTSLKYLWNTSLIEPSEEDFQTTFTNEATINSPVDATGGYYLWVIAKDNQDNTTITRTNVFNLDNTPPIITMNGSSPITIDQGDEYTDAGATVNDSHSGTGSVITTGTINVNAIGTYYVYYNVSDNAGNTAVEVIRTVNVESNFIASEGVNKPKLAPNMKAIKWNGITEQTVSNPDTDTSWYDYSNKEWANAKTADGSYWVWIPRYAYQIASGYNTNTASTINIKYLKNGTDIASDDTTVAITPTYNESSQTNFIKHPAFTFGSTELTGIWVAKFEMSGTTSALNSQPNVASLRVIALGSMFTASRNMEKTNRYGWVQESGTLNGNGTFTTNTNNIDTHMMKNTEWGAIVYLSKSEYGIDNEIYSNPSASYITGRGGTHFHKQVPLTPLVLLQQPYMVLMAEIVQVRREMYVQEVFMQHMEKHHQQQEIYMVFMICVAGHLNTQCLIITI